ncbi:metallo-beta-lactamase family protein [Anaerobacterium chartisolvens]|uniref:Metallo-beta-lactamase family protein n=1 Tax=Anaerobacterium chartisolvens TaxID=1297424 RepID=A0A369BEK5_9FIRM|nr:MBL fold metallo-hydrolase [Anaerobacterium chartisolvens]RCX19982.1 metallo-beta-lactamase family protein [Anaerobacterium chartisolvens]
MKITFLGAAKTVTGSCCLLETGDVKFLVDCGLFQGRSKEDALNQEPFPFNPSEIDFILLTHSHIDHSGRIPKIYNDGFRGEVIATKATADLCSIMLPDCGHIQEFENEWLNRKRERAGRPPVEPLYTHQDALDSMSLFRSEEYDEIIELNCGIRFRFNDAGHILGSSIIEVWFTEEGRDSKIVFSGDLGNRDIPILRDPSIIEEADYLVIESTYGNRLHVDNKNKVERFVDIINDTVKKGGNVVIPSFAVGRTQEIIYDLRKKRDDYNSKIESLMNVPVFIDSPLAISATEIFRKNLDCYDSEARAYIENGENPLDFPGLQFTKTPDESRALNERKESSIIISASGMCEAGRIKHHLKHNLWRPESTILFVGYQAMGTLGRRLVDGANKVKIFGEDITVNARIEMIDGFSGHADRDGLVNWIGGFRKKKPRKIFIVHGEERVMDEFSELIEKQFNIDTVIPDKGESFTINSSEFIKSVREGTSTYQFKRLAVIDILETLKEEFDELADILKSDLKQGKSDTEVDMLYERLKNLGKMMIDVL